MRLIRRRPPTDRAAREVADNLRAAARDASNSTARIDRAIERYRWLTELGAAEEALRSREEQHNG